MYSGFIRQITDFIIIIRGRALDFGLIGVSTCGFESHQGPFRSLTFPPVLRDWVIKGLGMSSLVYATGHIKDPVPLIEKRKGLSPGGRFPPSFIHQVIIITGLNKLQLYVLALKMALDADRAQNPHSTQPNHHFTALI